MEYMNYIQNQNNVFVMYPDDLVQSVAQMAYEHFSDLFQDTVICVNLNDVDFRNFLNDNGFEHHRYVLYNLEHKWPIGSPINSGWNDIFTEVVKQTNFVMDFQIENYPYFKAIGYDYKFKFFPLRYTTWFEQFVDKNIEKIYELQFDGKLCSDVRKYAVGVIAGPAYDVDRIGQIQLLISNTYDQKVKFQSKQMCKYCLDLPQYDYSETINTLRIFENTCLDCPTIVYDKYGETMNYFPGIIHVFDHGSFNTNNLKRYIMESDPTPPAQLFKDLTYDDNAYDNYRISILQEFRDRYGIMIPDSVLRID